MVQLAELVGVNESTVYRWENSTGDIHVDPRQSHLLLMAIGIAARPDAKELGVAIRDAIKLNPIYGLYRLLQIGIGEES